ncbi:hypothetical protein ACWIDW_04900 [Microbacterium sp. NPDC055312]
MSVNMQPFYAEQERLRQCYRNRELEVEVQDERGPERLADYASSRDLEIRSRVALNWSTPESVLRQLAEDPSADVRQSVAANLMTPPDVLESLAQEDTYWMRFSLAGNPSTPAAVDSRLREVDPGSYERARGLKAGGFRSRVRSLMQEASA